MAGAGGGGGVEGSGEEGRERGWKFCQERHVHPNGGLALLGLSCPLVATVSRKRLPVIAPWNGRSWEKPAVPSSF